MYSTLDSLNTDLVNCRKCPRLVKWREKMALEKKRAYLGWEYWGRPVPAFGDPGARILVVGLAPGAHGSNRTGRMFTGDASGDFLYPALYRAGFASQPTSSYKGDGLCLHNLLITAVCRCAPPENKPTQGEIHNCLPWMLQEVALLPRLAGYVALGRIAFDGILSLLKMQGISIPPIQFSHGALHMVAKGLPWILCTYHPSRQNTQTGRLTPAMFDTVWQKAADLL